MTTMLERAASITTTDASSRRRPDASARRPVVVPGRRDASVDLVRALCLVVVVGLHAMMVGVSLVDGAPVIVNAMEHWEGFALVTWLVQIMPLFFVLGGFSAHRQWAGLRGRGSTSAEYLAKRLRRLLPPVAGAIATTALALGVLTIAGLPVELVGEAGTRLSQPLWFMGVYLLCTLLVPVMVRMHDAAPVMTTLGLVGVALGIDVVRAATGIDAVGLANLLFVWLAAQQLGFWIADGSVDRWSRSALRMLGAGALAAALALVLAGIASHDLFEALNPPSVVLVLLGVMQAAVVVLARERLQRAARRPVVAAAIGAINARAMTIYAWHMLALIGLAGGSLTIPALLPEPLSGEWWLSRPLWLLAVAIAVTALVRVAGGLETGALANRIAGGPTRPRTGRMVAAYLGAAAAVLAVLIFGGLPIVWAVAALALGAALAVARHAADPFGIRGPVATGRRSASGSAAASGPGAASGAGRAPGRGRALSLRRASVVP